MSAVTQKNLEDAVDLILEKMKAATKEIEAIRADVNRLRHSIDGNGVGGLRDDVIALKAWKESFTRAESSKSKDAEELAIAMIQEKGKTKRSIITTWAPVAMSIISLIVAGYAGIPKYKEFTDDKIKKRDLRQSKGQQNRSSQDMFPDKRVDGDSNAGTEGIRGSREIRVQP